MKRLLHDADNARRILDMTADTMLLINKDGICEDIETHSHLSFLQEDFLLGKNVFDLLPQHTREKLMPLFKLVLNERKEVTKNFKLPLEKQTFFFKCIMHPYDDKVLCQYRDITERSNIKLRLEQANKRLSEVHKVAKTGEWYYNTRNDFFSYKGHTEALSSEGKRDINFGNYINAIMPEDRRIFEEWKEKDQTEPCTEGVCYRLLIDGRVFYRRTKIYDYHRLPDGSFDISGYVQDITDVQQYKRNINTLTHAINNTSETLAAARQDGTLIFANRQFLLDFGIPEGADLEKLKIYDILNNLTQEVWKETCHNIQNGEHAHFSIEHPSKTNDKILATEGTIFKITDDENEVSYWTFAHDITDRINYEEKIKRFAQIIDATVENIPAGITVKDVNDDFRFIYRNRESYANNLFDDDGDATGKTDFDLYPREIAERKRKQDINVAATGQELHWIEEEKDCKGNPLFLDKRKLLIGKNGVTSPYIVSIEWDITEMELMKQKMQKEMEKADTANQQKSAFLANMSHEIRTPLNAIMGFSRLIAEANEPNDRNEYYQVVESNSERLLNLINEVLDLSKIESGTVEFTVKPTSLDGLCQEIHDAHKFRMQEGVQLIYEPSDKSLVIETDKNRVFQVVSNLIGNAVKFTTAGSISYGYKRKGKQVVFHVTDTGTGIEPDKVNRVFERFAKLNNIAQGTGLGLSISQSIVERLGGKISVESEFGKGTTFSFTLPYTDASGELDASQKGNPADTLQAMLANSSGEGVVGKRNAEDTANATKKSGKAEKSGTAETTENTEASDTAEKKRIMIAEDTDTNYDLLNALLGKKYRLVRAHDGMEAVLKFDETKPDLILMDIKMPNLDGLEATKIIRELSAAVPIIAQSAYAYEQDVAAALEAGCNDFIAKPISRAKLMEALNKWMPA